MFSSKLAEPVERAAKYIPKSRRFYAEMPYALEIDDYTIRTRENGLMMSLQIHGMDGLTAASHDLAKLGKDFSAILDGLDDRFTFYIHRLTRPAELGLKPIYGDRFEHDVDRAWRQHIAGRNLREFMLVLTVVRNQRTPIRLPIFAGTAKRLLDANTEDRLSELREVVSVLESSLRVRSRRLQISDGSLLGFLQAISTGLYTPQYRGQNTLIAEDVSLLSIRFKGRVAELRDGVDHPRFVAVMSIWRTGNQSWAGMLDGLDSATDVVVTHSFTPIAHDKISEIAKRRIQQMQAAGDFAGSIAADLSATYDDVESGRCGFGAHQLVISIFADSEAELENRVSMVRGIAEQAKIKLVRCNDTMAATYFSAHPGNQDYQIWEPITKSINFADMASFHMSEIGAAAAELPWRTPITVFQTATGAAHRFSFHERGNPESEPTLGHTLFLGPSNSGKTTVLAFLLSQARRVGARTILFDKDRGLRMAVAAMGGRYAEIKAGQPTGLNPLATETGPRGEAWLLDWLAGLVERSSGSRLTPHQSDVLKSAVRQNGEAPEELRTFAHFDALIGDVGDDREMGMRLAEWGPEGRYNWVFGAADEPIIDFNSSDLTGVDLTEILGLPVERTAVLSYIFHRLEMLFEEKKPTILVIDEASTVFDDDFFARWLPKWLVTVRKLNVVVVLLTQFPTHLRKTKSGQIIQALPNRLIFPNTKAEVADYEGFALTDNELDFILTARSAQRHALFKSHDSSTILNVDLSPLGNLLTVLGGGEAGVRAFGPDFASRPYFWRNPDEV